MKGNELKAICSLLNYEYVSVNKEYRFEVLKAEQVEGKWLLEIKRLEDDEEESK